MKYITSLLFAAVLLLAGCASTEDIAFKTTGTVVITANAAMNAWLDYKNTHTVPPDQIAKVKAMWDKFYTADQAERQAVAAFKTSTDTNSINVVIAMAAAASSDLITLIVQSLPPDKAIALKGAK